MQRFILTGEGLSCRGKLAVLGVRGELYQEAEEHLLPEEQFPGGQRLLQRGQSTSGAGGGRASGGREPSWGQGSV